MTAEAKRKYYLANKDFFHQKYLKRRDRVLAGRQRICRFCGSQFDYYVHRFHRYFCDAICAKKMELQKKRDHDKERLKNPSERLKESVRGTIRDCLKKRRCQYGKRVLAALPYSIDELRAHIERFFTRKNGFSWENYGKLWHIDHVIPSSKFQFTSLDEQGFKDAWALSNLRPEYVSVNCSKQNRYFGFFDKRGQLNFIA